MDTDAQGCQMSNYTYSQGEQTHAYTCYYDPQG
jgi:hypothetical protein